MVKLMSKVKVDCFLQTTSATLNENYLSQGPIVVVRTNRVSQRGNGDDPGRCHLLELN